MAKVSGSAILLKVCSPMPPARICAVLFLSFAGSSHHLLGHGLATIDSVNYVSSKPHKAAGRTNLAASLNQDIL